MKLDDFLSKKVTWKLDKRKTDSVKFVSKRLHWKLWLMSMRVINSLQTDCTTLKFYVSGGITDRPRPVNNISVLFPTEI